MRTIPVKGWGKSMAVVSPDEGRGEVAVDLRKLAAGRLWLKPKATKLLIKQLRMALKALPKKG
jgi:hypothetical protein